MLRVRRGEPPRREGVVRSGAFAVELEDLFVDIANGGDVTELATAADEKITPELGG